MLLIAIDTGYLSNDSQGHLYKAFLKDACEKVGVTLLNGIVRWGTSQAIATYEQVARLSAADPGMINVKVIDEIKSPVTVAELPLIVDSMVAKLEQLSSAYGNFNGRCDVHMPGNLLLQFNRILLLEDQCSDSLQEALDKGWRIISAQPQPDQRRPDYIMGRYDPSYDNDTCGNSAARRP